MKKRKTIFIVSGLPRSGTSLMMAMLQAGGLKLLTDNIRKPNEDNPKGYFEFERVKELKNKDFAWLKKAEGKAVKIIAAILKFLPSSYDYQIIFMLRNLDEILASQQQMLLRRGENYRQSDDKKLKDYYLRHLGVVKSWFKNQPNFKVIWVSYNDIIREPAKQAKKINRFLGDRLDVKKMISVVDPTLYRQRT